MKKRILSIFLTLALLLTLLPTAAFAAGNTICTDMIYKGTKTSSFAQPYAAIAELNANADTARSGATMDFSASNAMTSAVPEVPAGCHSDCIQNSLKQEARVSGQVKQHWPANHPLLEKCTF